MKNHANIDLQGFCVNERVSGYLVWHSWANLRRKLPKGYIRTKFQVLNFGKQRFY